MASEAEDQARLAFEEAPVGLLLSHDRVIARCNLRFAEIFDVDGAASLVRFYPSAEEFERIGQIGLRAMQGAGRHADERIMRRAGGELFWCRVRGRSLSPEDPFRAAVWSFVDLSDTRPVTELTQRERQVAMLLVEGRTSKEIARTLGISPRTAEAHRARLLDKLSARNSAELIARPAGVPL